MPIKDFRAKFVCVVILFALKYWWVYVKNPILTICRRNLKDLQLCKGDNLSFVKVIIWALQKR